MISLPDCDITSEFYTERLVVASGRSKRLVCCECHHPIERGEKYYRCSGKCEGNMWSDAQHIYCWTFARSLNGVDSADLYKSYYDAEPQLMPGQGRNPWAFNDGYGGCISFGGIAEFLNEAGDDLDELPHNPEIFWDRIISGCREKFECGAGI